MSDFRDFMSTHPVPDPPAPPVDYTKTVHTARSMTIVDPTVCRFDPRNPCDHEHAGPIFRPQPDLDESGVGWTVQHTPKNFDAWKVDKRCVLCWKRVPDLSDHTCQVIAVLNG